MIINSVFKILNEINIIVLDVKLKKGQTHYFKNLEIIISVKDGLELDVVQSNLLASDMFIEVNRLIC